MIEEELKPKTETLQEIDSGSVLEMVDSSSIQLLDEINSKQRKIRLFPVSLTLFILLSLYLAHMAEVGWLAFTAFVLGIFGTILIYFRDELEKSVVIFYDFDESAIKAYEKLDNAFAEIDACARNWHVDASGQVHDRKYHAGASTVVSRKIIKTQTGRIHLLKTNIKLPTIPVGKQTLAFMPDRLLVFAPKAVGAVSYKDLIIDVSSTRFVETEQVPRDSEIVDHTWRYVNKSGGPDKRFRDNSRIPIALYEEVHFQSASGLNELIQLSRTGVGQHLKQAIAGLASLAGQNEMKSQHD